MEGHLRRADEARGVNFELLLFTLNSAKIRLKNPLKFSPKTRLNSSLIAVNKFCARARIVGMRRYLFNRRYFTANGLNLKRFDVKFDFLPD